MKRPRVLRCTWDGTTFLPDAASQRFCRETMGLGEEVLLERNEQRSEASHGHYFSSLNEAWSQLRENQIVEYPTVDALRSKALIRTGFCHERHTVCSSPDEARKIAAFIQPLNHYAVVDVRDTVIRVYTAKSQSRSAMNKKEFQDSKDAVLQFVSNLIGVTPDQLKTNAARSA